MVQMCIRDRPNTLHYEWAVKAMKSGKHVLCEKPLTPSEKQVKELFDKAKENLVYLMEAFAYHHSPYITEIKKELEDGTVTSPMLAYLLVDPPITLIVSNSLAPVLSATLSLLSC